MVRSQGRLSPPRKLPKNFQARKYASCTTSSASCSFHVSQRARLYAASRCGKTTCSKRARLLWACKRSSFTTWGSWAQHYLVQDCFLHFFIPSTLFPTLRRNIATEKPVWRATSDPP